MSPHPPPPEPCTSRGRASALCRGGCVDAQCVSAPLSGGGGDKRFARRFPPTLRPHPDGPAPEGGEEAAAPELRWGFERTSRAEDSAARPGSERSGRVRLTSPPPSLSPPPPPPSHATPPPRFGRNLIGSSLLTERLVGWSVVGCCLELEAGCRTASARALASGGGESPSVGRSVGRSFPAGDRSSQGPAGAAPWGFCAFPFRGLTPLHTGLTD